MLLDFCDGTVARMANKISKMAFRYDHMSDIFKISLLILGVGIRFDDLLYWILSATFIFTYTYSEILSHDLKNINERRHYESRDPLMPQEKLDNKRLRERFLLVGYVTKKFPFVVNVARQTYTALTSFNGHTLLVFFMLPIGGWVTVAVLFYLITLTVISNYSDINSLWNMSR